MLSNYDLYDMSRRIHIPLNGIYTKDRLPPIIKEGNYIINYQNDMNHLTNEVQNGTHWIGIYREKDNVAVFDSFGLPLPVEIRIWLKKYRQIYTNTKQIQNIRQSICGYYSLYFLFYMNQRKDKPFSQRFNEFIRQFSYDTTKNNDILRKKFRIKKIVE